ncbi:MAG: hypothetical protein ABJN22_12435 [Litorimonas sp.]
MLNVHSTRLFPKNHGADGYKITGIAAKCDWVVLSDLRPPYTHIHKNIPTKKPKSIFLSLRSQEVALNFFSDEVLPTLQSQFVLFSGSSDATLPKQIDSRWKPLSQKGKTCFQAILNHPHLRHWAMENADESSHPLISPLPLGLVFTDKPHIRECIEIPESPKLKDRPLRVLCGHRVRDGLQWDARKTITNTAKQDWSDFTTILEEDISEPEFLKLIQQHTFVLCAEGGGLDPSPKAWQALIHGAIPIIRRTALSEAYERLPVVLVDDWSARSIQLSQLRAWKAQHIEEYDDPDLREKVLEKLSVGYWWEQVMNLR